MLGNLCPWLGTSCPLAFRSPMTSTRIASPSPVETLLVEVAGVSYPLTLVRIEGRIGDVNKPEASFPDAATLCILSNKADGQDSPFSIEVDVRALVKADVDHSTGDSRFGPNLGALVEAGITNGAIKGTVDGIHAPTSRYMARAEGGLTIRLDCESVLSFWCEVDILFKKQPKASLDTIKTFDTPSGVKRIFDEVDGSPPEIAATPALAPPPPSPVAATPAAAAPLSQPPKLSRTMSFEP